MAFIASHAPAVGLASYAAGNDNVNLTPPAVDVSAYLPASQISGGEHIITGLSVSPLGTGTGNSTARQL